MDCSRPLFGILFPFLMALCLRALIKWMDRNGGAAPSPDGEGESRSSPAPITQKARKC